MIKQSKLLLAGIIFLAAISRFLFLGEIPPSLTWDEVAWGYNSYSLGIDLKDEFGKFLPVTYLESFGDFKPPLYAYLGIIPVKFIGLNEFSTRFPSAFFGTLSVLLTYFFVKEIFGKEKISLALFSAFLLAISPWHIMLSRAAFEANVAHFFVLLGLVLFFKGIARSSWLLIISAVSFVASLYTFNSARIVVPLLVVFLFVKFYKELFARWRITLFSGIIGFVLFLPLLLFLNTPQAKLRFEEVNIFSDISTVHRINQEVENDNNSVLSKIIHNRRFTYGVEYLRHYFDNLTPQFLFVKGDGNPKFSIQDVGQMYIWEIPFLVIGILVLFKRREQHWWVIPLILTVGIIPAGFARETPHALRIENALPAFQILTAIGVLYIMSIIPKRSKRIFTGIIVAAVGMGVIYFGHNYFTHYSRIYSQEWQYGYEEAVKYVEQVRPEYSNIYVTEALGRPYIYFLFYMNYDPVAFRKEAGVYREVLGFVHVNKFSNIIFSKDMSSINETDSLYIATPGEIPDDAKILKDFKLLNGNTILLAYTL